MRIKHHRTPVVFLAIAALILPTAAVAAPNTTARFNYYYVKSPVVRGLQAHVVVGASRAGLCRITVSKGGTQMRPQRIDRWGLGLYPKRSRREYDYRVAWTWKVPSKTMLGLWRVRVNCGRAGILQKTFKVIG